MSLDQVTTGGQIDPSANGDKGSAGSGRGKPAGRPRWSAAWFAGVDLRVLEEVPSEQTFYRRLGWSVFLLSCFSGAALSLALGYALDGTALSYLWAGVAWTVLLAVGVEPLILQLSPTRRRWVMGIAVTWRVAFSVLLALQLSEPLILRIDEPEIQQKLEDERQVAIKGANERVREAFGPGIDEDLEQVKEINQRETELEAKESNFRFLSEQSAETECGPACHHYTARANQVAGKLAAAKAKNSDRLEKLEKEINRLQQERGEARQDSTKKIDDGHGLWARIGALNAIVRTRPDMNAEVWALRLLFLLLDLLPLTAKLFRLAIQSPYEKEVAAARRRDLLPAFTSEAAAGVEEYRVEEQARAEREVARTAIMLDTDRRIHDAGAGFANGSSFTGPPANAGSPPISAFNLRDYVEKMRSHDALPVPVPAELTRAGLVGAALLGALLVISTLVTTLTGSTVEGLWLVAVIFVAAAALAAYTRGFRRAPAWALRAIFVTFLVGLFLPIVIVAINL